MSGWLFFASIVIVGTLLMVIAGCSLFARPPKVTSGGKHLRFVKLPEHFRTQISGKSYRIFWQYLEIRMSDVGGEKAMLLRGSDMAKPAEFAEDSNGKLFVKREIEYEYSENMYAVSLDGSFTVRGVDSLEWERGRPLPTDDERRADESNRDVYNPDGSLTIFNVNDRGVIGYDNIDAKNFVDFKGRSYKASGKELNSTALLSQDAKWAAVFSHTSRRRLFKRPSLFPFLGGDDRIASGTMYVDIYDVGTGERIAAAQTPHRGSGDMYVFKQAVWVEGRYFLMPLRTSPPIYMVGAMPGR